jgi:predicted nucleotidyltransferase
MNLFEEEIVRFLSVLTKHEVRFILVGGLAVNFHGYSRTTGDVDLWMEESQENRKKLVNALKEFEIEGAEIFLTHPLIAGYSELLLDNGIYVDFMSDLQFFKQNNFNECYEIADFFKINETIHVPVLHINKLISEKQQSSRPKDQDDAEQLIKLHRKN